MEHEQRQPGGHMGEAGEAAAVAAPSAPTRGLEAGPPLVPLSLEDAALYEKCRKQLAKRPGALFKALLLGATLLLFGLVDFLQTGSLLDVGLLVAVLTFHEAGHWAGMRAFGYRDVTVFFIPLLGAAVSGRRGSVEAWKEGVVLLLGPLPGLLLGIGLAVAFRGAGGPIASLTSLLLFLNAFNLLPFSILDGGRLLQLTLFARRPWLEVAFLVVGALGLAAAAVLLDARGLMTVAVASLVWIPARRRLAREAAGLRAAALDLPDDPKLLGEEAGVEVFRAALRAARSRSVRRVAQFMEGLLEQVSQRTPPWPESVRLVGAWAAALAVGVAGVWLVLHPPLEWQVVTASFARVEMPGAPEASEKDLDSPSGKIHQRTFTLDKGSLGVGLVEHTYSEPGRAFVENHQALVLGMKKELLASMPGWRLRRERTWEVPGTGRFWRVVLEQGRSQLVYQSVVHGPHQLLLTVAAPDSGTVDRVLHSLRLPWKATGPAVRLPNPKADETAPAPADDAEESD